MPVAAAWTGLDSSSMAGGSLASTSSAAAALPRLLEDDLPATLLVAALFVEAASFLGAASAFGAVAALLLGAGAAFLSAAALLARVAAFAVALGCAADLLGALRFVTALLLLLGLSSSAASSAASSAFLDGARDLGRLVAAATVSLPTAFLAATSFFWAALGFAADALALTAGFGFAAGFAPAALVPALALGVVVVLAFGAGVDFFAAALGLAAVSFLVAMAAVALDALGTGWVACKKPLITSAVVRASPWYNIIAYRTQQALRSLAGRQCSAGGKNVLP